MKTLEQCLAAFPAINHGPIDKKVYNNALRDLAAAIRVAPEPQPEVAAEPVDTYRLLKETLFSLIRAGAEKDMQYGGVLIDLGKYARISFEVYGPFATPPVVEEAVKAEPRVRELVWTREGLEGLSASTPAGNYRISLPYRGSHFPVVLYREGQKLGEWPNASLNEVGDEYVLPAKAAAQADFTALILSALSSGNAS